MRSIIGIKGTWNTSEENPYKIYCYGLKQEGEQITGKFAKEEDAINALMQTIIDEVLKHRDKNIVWRLFPTVTIEKEFCNFTETVTIWYKACARFCFE